MKLLETVPQDIKLNRKFKPCAPSFFRWIVVGGYLLVLLSGFFYVGVQVWEKKSTASSMAEKKKLDEVNGQISSLRSQGEQVLALREKYNQAQQWLKGNYSMAGLLSEIFAALPENTRIQEMEVKNLQTQGQFLLKLKLFRQSGTLTPSFGGMEDKLTGGALLLTEPEANDTEAAGGDYATMISVGQKFFPQPNGAGRANPTKGGGL